MESAFLPVLGPCSAGGFGAHAHVPQVSESPADIICLTRQAAPQDGRR